MQQDHILHQARPHVLDVSRDRLNMDYAQQASRIQRPVSGHLCCSRLGCVGMVQLQLSWCISVVPPPAGSGGIELKICIDAAMIVWAAGVRQSAHMQEACTMAMRCSCFRYSASSAMQLLLLSACTAVTRCHQGESMHDRLFHDMLGLLRIPEKSTWRHGAELSSTLT